MVDPHPPNLSMKHHTCPPNDYNNNGARDMGDHDKKT